MNKRTVKKSAKKAVKKPIISLRKTIKVKPIVYTQTKVYNTLSGSKWKSLSEIAKKVYGNPLKTQEVYWLIDNLRRRKNIDIKFNQFKKGYIKA